jgi:hypothetical protein
MFDPVLEPDCHTLTKHFGGVASPAKAGEDGVTDVAAFSSESFVEFEADGHSPHEFFCDFGCQKSGPHAIWTEIDAPSRALRIFNPGAPIRSFLVAEEKGEIVSGKILMSRQCRFFVPWFK